MFFEMKKETKSPKKSKHATKQHVVVLGYGNYGTALAQQLASNNHQVFVWCRNENTANHINHYHNNPKYLSHVTLSKYISATNNFLKLHIESAKALVIAVPTQTLRNVLLQMKECFGKDFKKKLPLIICAAKGIEENTLAFPLNIIEDITDKKTMQQSVFLSGPSFAQEIVDRQPTCVSVASYKNSSTEIAQELFHSSLFRVYSSNDPIGLEIAGALKNVIAIASGACSGLGYQYNSRAALITRGLGEIAKIGTKLGAKPITFMGLGGVGDLFLTCTSEKSRNYTVGYRLGVGEKLDHILKTMGSVAEGVATTKAAYQLIQKLKMTSPIIETVYHVLYQDKPIRDAVDDLLGRDAKEEFFI